MASWPSYLWEQGGAGGWFRFWWNDANSNDAADLNELYWTDYSTTARTAYRAFDDAESSAAATRNKCRIASAPS